MKYLIFSDAHGDRKEFERLIEKFKNDSEIETIFYNGDSEFKADDEIFYGLQSVVGNMDFSEPFNEFNLYESKNDDVVFYQNHGHLNNANSTLDEMWQNADEFGADIILFGHTHIVLTEVYKEKLFINPGSISLPKGPNANLGGTYVILTIENNDYSVEYYSRDDQKINSISKKFIRENKL